MEPLVENEFWTNSTLEILPESGTAGTLRTTSDSTFMAFVFSVRNILIPIIFVLSFISGVVNIITFSKMDLSQGVNQNLLILSASDCAMNVLILVTLILRWLVQEGHTGGKVLPLLSVSIVAMANGPIYVSLIVTTVIAVVRCCSIVMPLSFRRIFTTRRQLAVIFFCGVIVTVVPWYVAISFFIAHIKPAPTITVNNVTMFVNVWRGNIMGLIFNSSRNILFYSCLSIITFSMVFLITALRRSSQFRRQASTMKSTDPSNRSSVKSSSTRETQVFKTVILVLAIFVVCNVPLTILSFLRLAIRDFGSSVKYYLYDKIMDLIVELTVGLNTGLNFFVYYSCNSQFRRIVQAVFGINKTAEKQT